MANVTTVLVWEQLKVNVVGLRSAEEIEVAKALGYSTQLPLDGDNLNKGLIACHTEEEARKRQGAIDTAVAEAKAVATAQETAS